MAQEGWLLSRLAEADRQDGLWHNVIDASRGGRSFLMPPQEAAKFFARVKREKVNAKL